MVKSFVKQVGGKTKLLPEILKHVPSFSGSYHEPFVGGGSVFMAVCQKEKLQAPHAVWAHLNDSNSELMNAYRTVRDTPDDVVRELQSLKHSEKNYYAIRGRDEKMRLNRAVRFLYLNRTCFNGIYRVNAKGKFNVPLGKKSDGSLMSFTIEPDLFLSWARALEGAALHSEDFEARLSGMKVSKWDFVYCDPPYLPRSKTANFTSYTANKFDKKDHERLAHALTNVHKQGAKFLCSQGDSETIRLLYKAFEIVPVTVRHSVGASASSRGRVAELLIKNYD